MGYPKDFFLLQICFAKKVIEVEQISLAEALRLYTGFYKYFEISDWEFDENNPIWQTYLTLVETSDDIVETSYQFYLTRQMNHDPEEHFGCFSYNFEPDDNAVQIHFHNQGDQNPGALSKAMIEVRKAELKRMFSAIKEKYPNLKEIWGFSWLYNIEAYQRLFPKEYLETRVEVEDWFRSQALWGQFLDKYAKVKKDLANDFLACTQGKHTKDELRMCFPFRIQELVVNPQVFYQFYQIQ